jgi:hypothetical protein
MTLHFTFRPIDQTPLVSEICGEEVETSNSIISPSACSIDIKFGQSMDLDTANVCSAAPGGQPYGFRTTGDNLSEN